MTAQLARTAHTVKGTVASGYEAVADRLAQFIDGDPRYSAYFCAYASGQLVVDVWGGPDADDDIIQGVFSATKGVSAVCIASLVERDAIDLDAEVRRYWPEFAQGGKDAVTVRMALSHQAGLSGVEPQVTLEQLLDHVYMAERVAAQVPHWLPGKAHGYHALTIGTLMDELVRRITGSPLAQFFRDEIGEPRAVDFYVAVPEDQEARVRDVLPPRPADDVKAVGEAVQPVDAASLTGMAFSAAALNAFDPPLPNLRAVRAAGLASVGGAGSARGLARLYASCISEVDGMPRMLSAETISKVSQIQAAGQDMVLPFQTRWAIGFQKTDERLRYGSHQAFGHDGAGGAIGVGDPWHGLAYGYVPRRMSSTGAAEPRGMVLAQTARECLAQLRG